MNPILRNSLALLAGAVVGSIVNGSIISVSGSIIPPPPGADLATPEGLKAAMPLFEPKHFLMPFLAHALGTLVGAFLAAKIAANNKLIFAMVIGALFLAGGMYMVYLLPSPLWFSVADLGLAYLPMAFLGYKLAVK